VEPEIFSKEFWLNRWERSRKEDSFNVHQGFSTPEYWNRAAASYDRNTDELSSRGIEKTLDIFKRNGMLFKGMKVLEIACGTGLLALELARHGARVTAVDFSVDMLDRFRERIPAGLENNLDILLMDWNTLDLKAMGWEKQFDLVIGFMAPALSVPESFFKMMAASRTACAMKGWAAKRNHPILNGLWQEIMDEPLEDKPQSLMIKFNILFSMGFLPELSFDTIVWEKTVDIEEEFSKQLAFFKKISNRPEPDLKHLIRKFLESIADNSTIVREQSGTTGTVFWKL